MLGDGEKIYIRSWYAQSSEDSYEKGEIGGGASWSARETCFGKWGPYDSPADAVKAVCEANCFAFGPGSWISVYEETGDEADLGRFDGDVMVDAENSEADDSDLAAWREGKTRLWNCHLTVRLEVRRVRPLDPSLCRWPGETKAGREA